MMRQAGAKWLYEIQGDVPQGGEGIDPSVRPPDSAETGTWEKQQGETADTPVNNFGGLGCKAFPPSVPATAWLLAA